MSYLLVLTGLLVGQAFTHTHSLSAFHYITVDHKHLLKAAQLELKKSKRKDYYKVLGVGKNATEDEIKKAYRKRALMHHPGSSLCLYTLILMVIYVGDSFIENLHSCCLADRHSAATPEVQKEEEKKFKEVGEAFTVLSDPKKKIRYDNGHDLADDGGFDGGGKRLRSTSRSFVG